MATDGLVKLDGWPLGVDNVREEYDLVKQTLREAVNVDITGSGKLRRRAGYTPRVAATDAHSLWAYGDTVLYVSDGYLWKLDSKTWTTTNILSGLTEATLSYEGVGQYVYFTDGSRLGRCDTLSGAAEWGWGVDTPGGQPNAQALNYGGLAAGKYQLAVTFRAFSGLESGTSEAVTVEVPAGGGIQLSDLPQGVGETVRVYCSTANGTSDELWHVADYPMGTQSAFVAQFTPGRAIRTQFLEPLPAGQIIRRFQGRVYTAKDNVLFFSEPFRFHLYAPDDNYIVFPSRVTVVEPSLDGLYVVADKTYFLAGTEPKQFSFREMGTSGAAEGTSRQLPGNVFPQLKTNHAVAYWFSERGPVVGLPGGQIVYLLDGRLAVDQYLRGASLLREQNGVRQVITSLLGPGEGSSFAATDSSVMTVFRNGIEV